ncbi:RNA polymerase sigma factor [Spirosoma utsteinense]|uniref:RNA polymerase sigma-70 factor (ECF subfamily) n=1 Tax=Spirosoma utsteinense TaxID=2585773 RepID=A0ABR6W5N0_9BACT|nr:sigma-70 family RNA polymerase sigma factor [Spirosoma utsteinense]MBC3784732.1 RNA polymerase sigma-70 factor (ECF subfamily) [Spirosoma utsteinense]MBC3791232.1 RNA polymerase sigma-70 factor (ECF subfamily) [Spirosoma utsteinense]
MLRLATPPDISDHDSTEGDPVERDLVRGCLSADLPDRRSAQRALYERYKRAMFSTAYRITSDYDHANDVLQDAFVEVFRHLGQFAFRSTLGSWIKTIVVRQAIRKQQQEGRFLTLDETIHDQPAPFRDTLTGAELDAAIRTLPDGARTIFLLAEVEGYAHKEIAAMLGISEGTSKSQTSYAKKLLRQRLS